MLLTPLNASKARFQAGLFSACLILMLALPTQPHAGLFDWGRDKSAPTELTLATWNMEWLMTPRAHEDMAPPPGARLWWTGLTHLFR